jgi:hypothetical protein
MGSRAGAELGRRRAAADELVGAAAQHRRGKGAAARLDDLGAPGFDHGAAGGAARFDNDEYAPRCTPQRSYTRHPSLERNARLLAGPILL